MYLSKYIQKADLEKGYRAVKRPEFQHTLCSMFVRVLHPISGLIQEFTLVDPSLIMGGKNSVQDFDLVMSSHVRALVFHRFDLFSSDPSRQEYNLRLLFSYLDDYMCAADSLDHATQQYVVFSEIGSQLGLVFSPEKFEPPSQQQTLLGVVYNTLHKLVALKAGKPEKVKEMLVKFAAARWQSKKEIEEVLGNLIQTSMILPGIRAFTTSFILYFLIASRSTSQKVDRWTMPLLNENATDSLNFLIYLLDLDPKCSVYRFLDLQPSKKVFPFSDASGQERSPKNPSPGTLGGFFIDKKAGIQFAFSMPQSELLELLPKGCQNALEMPHINYLEMFSVFLVVVQLILYFPKLVYRKRIIIKLDSQVAAAQYGNGRCPTFPVHRLIQTLAVLEWKYQCVIHPVWIRSDQNPADKLTRRLPHATGPVRLNLPNRQTFYITPKRVPPKVLALFVDSILGKVDYGKLLGKEALLLHFDRSSRFLPPVCITPFNPFADWISVISTAFYKASRLSYFPTIPSLVSPM